MTSGNVQVSQDGPVAVLTLTRPKKLNAVDSAALTELHRALADADADPAVRVVVLTGSGERAFCAGADIHEMAQSSPASYRDGLGTLFVRIVERMRGMGKPVIAAVNGYAFWGTTGRRSSPCWARPSPRPRRRAWAS
ncbi:MAG: enoyl-CoA hydratase/isomerase family protein [candidate division NC10 bacterium]|nr:enoyl-CoA hydratase/isomerase family protein [candidate division NC10 bacterium]